MELTKDAIKELIVLKNEYEKNEKLADKKFIRRALDIIEAEERFHNLLKYNFDDDLNWPCMEENELVSIDIKSMLKFSKKDLSLYKDDYYPEEFFAIRNIKVLYCLIHEASHVWQFCGLDDYDEINRLYYEINLVEDTFYNRLMYKLFAYYHSFERHANVDAYRELTKIYEKSKYARIPSINHMVCLSDFYGLLSPVEKTLLLMHIENDFNTENIPTPTLINIGFRISKKDFKELNQIIIKEAKGIIDYKESIRLINKL